ncbi:hypothetical protein [Mucilaginibacter sp.]
MTISASQLPPLDNFRNLSTENINEFHAKGHTLVKGILSGEEIATYRPVIVDPNVTIPKIVN